MCVCETLDSLNAKLVLLVVTHCLIEPQSFHGGLEVTSELFHHYRK